MQSIMQIRAAEKFAKMHQNASCTDLTKNGSLKTSLNSPLPSQQELSLKSKVSNGFAMNAVRVSIRESSPQLRQSNFSNRSLP
jgi:hypothetical protein